MKKTVVLLICVCLVFGFASSVYAADAYRDVPGEAWYAEAVEYVTANKMMIGDGNNSFTPDEPATRAMIVTVLWRLAGEPKVYGGAFSDVSVLDWYFTSAAWGHISNIVEGYSIDLAIPEEVGYRFVFKGEQTVTREELACFLYRYAKYAGADVSESASLEGFADAASVSDWAEEALGWCVAEGILQGTPAGDSLNLAPADHATRAEVAAMLMRYCEMIEG